MPRPLAARIALIEPFLAMEVMERAFAIERAGGKVLHLEIGEPDFPPPPAAVEACAAALREGETRYTDSRGLLELREAIAADLARRFAVRVDPERVIVTSGTSPAMLLVFSLLVDPGDEVVIGTPHYPCYPSFVRACGGVPVFVPTDPARGYPLDPDAVRAAVTPRTRAIVVGSPANPTGAVQSAETLRAIAALGVPLVSDEIYDGLVYGGARVTSALAVSDDAYVLDGFSKRYAMTGFRLGWLVAPRERVRPLQILSQNLFISANRFVQRAGIAALAHGDGDACARCATPTRGAATAWWRGCARSASACRTCPTARSTCSPTRARSAATRARSRSSCSSARTSAPRPASTSAPRARAGCASRTRRPTRRSRRRSRGSPARCRRGDERRRAPPPHHDRGADHERRERVGLPARPARPRSRSSAARTSASRAC